PERDPGTRRGRAAICITARPRRWLLHAVSTADHPEEEGDQGDDSDDECDPQQPVERRVEATDDREDDRDDDDQHQCDVHWSLLLFVRLRCWHHFSREAVALTRILR